MEKSGESKEKRKMSVGRSLTMRFSNYRNRGKSVDKCGRLTGNMSNFGKPLTTSFSMGAMDRVHDITDDGTGCACGLGCTIGNHGNLSQAKLKGKSADKLTCVECENERLKCAGIVRLESLSVRAAHMAGSSGFGRSEAPHNAPPDLPPHGSENAEALAKSWDKIYASRKG